MLALLQSYYRPSQTPAEVIRVEVYMEPRFFDYGFPPTRSRIVVIYLERYIYRYSLEQVILLIQRVNLEYLDLYYGSIRVPHIVQGDDPNTLNVGSHYHFRNLELIEF